MAGAVGGSGGASAPIGSKPPGTGGTTPQPRVPAGAVISRVQDAGKRVAITFDDGPHGTYTSQVLSTLDRRNAKATFYVVGEQARQYPGKLRRMRREGHAIGNHSNRHEHLSQSSDSKVRSSLKAASDAIQRATGERPDHFRPPGMYRNARIDAIARTQGMRDILWDVDTRDWERPGSQAIARTAIANARSGSIILMHDGGGNRSQTVAALDQVITGLRAKGYKLVTVPELIRAGNRGG